MPQIYKGRVVNLSVDRVKLPNGNIINLELIRHPGAALIVPFLSKDKVVILRQYRKAVGGYLFELPAGTLDKNESPLSCAKREIIEEAGYSAKIFTKLGYVYPVPGYSTEKITIFKAQKLKKAASATEKDEVIQEMVVSKAQIRRLFKAGKIVDAKTICAFALCGWL